LALFDGLGTYAGRVTVIEVIRRSTDYLAQRGVDSPRLQIELLLAHQLGLPRLQLYLNFERALAEDQLAAVRELVRRRGQREPLQHLLGSTSFCGLEIAVSRHVLVPRPETETLAERGWRFLQALRNPAATALDVGTGSGCLAVALSVNIPDVHVTAVDISPEALAIAQTNAARHGVAGRIEFHLGDSLAAVDAGRRFDLIVSNPPYIPAGEIQSLQPEVRDFDPRVALDGGPDGLGMIRRLALEAPPFLKPGGRLMLEFGDGQAAAVQEVFSAGGWRVEAVESDLGGRERILVAQLPRP
jgi:release factor glutamine methyltransferase